MSRDPVLEEPGRTWPMEVRVSGSCAFSPIRWPFLHHDSLLERRAMLCRTGYLVVLAALLVVDALPQPTAQGSTVIQGRPSIGQKQAYKKRVGNLDRFDSSFLEAELASLDAKYSREPRNQTSRAALLRARSAYGESLTNGEFFSPSEWFAELRSDSFPPRREQCVLLRGRRRRDAGPEFRKPALPIYRSKLPFRAGRCPSRAGY